MAGNIPMGSMSTEIKLNGSQSVRTLRELKQAVTQATSAWKAQRAELSTIGKSAKAVEAKYKGLAETINKQKDYISGLREAQKHLQEAQKSVDRSTREGRQEYGKYNEALQKNETRLHSAQQKLAGLANQQSKAHKSLDYYKSGLADVQKQLKSSESVAKSYVVRLKAEGKGYESAKAKLNSYKNSLTNLKKQQSIQTQELSRIAKETGKSSDAYKRQEVRVNQTATSIAKLNGKIKSSQTEVNKLNPHGFNKLANGAKHVTNAADKMKSSFKHAWDNIKTGATAAAAGIGAVGAATISGAKKAGNLQQTYKEITNLAVTGGEKQREAIKNVTAMQRQGRDMSIKYGKSQQDIAEAFEDLVKRGYTTKQALGAMKTELQASVASGDDFKDVVSVSSTVLESFGMRAKTVTQMTSNTKRAVNELAYAADMTSTGFKDLGYGMSYVGSSAHQAGFNLSETASAMGILSNNGLEASKAGTGLNQVINRLSDATGKLVKGDKKNVLAQLGIKPEEITDSTGKLRNLATVFGVLNKHMKGMTKIQKINIMKSLFGMSGEQAGLILAKYNKQLGSLSKNVLKAGKDGKYVADLSAKNSQTAKMQMARLKQAGNAFTMTLGAKMLPAINEAGNSLVVFLTKSKDGKRLTNDFAKAVEGLAIGLANTIKLIAHHRAETKIIATGLGAAYGVVKLASLVQWLNKTRLALQGLNVVSHIAGGFKKVGSVLKVTGSLFKATGKTMGRSFVHQLGLISKGIKGLGSGILKAAKAIGSKALSAGKLIGSKITQGIKATTKFSMGKRLATGALAGAAVATPEAINAVKDRHSANKRSQDIGGAVGALAGGTLTSMIPVVGPMLAPVGAIIGKYTGRWGGQAVNNFTKGWQKNKPPKKFWSLENLGYSAHNMWNGFMKGVTNTIKWFKKNWKEVGLYFVSPLAGAINSLYKHNKGFHKWVNSLVKSFKNAWKGIGKWFGNIGKSIQKSWKGMPKWFTKLGKNMSKGIKSSWKGVTKWFSNVGKDIQKAWKGMTKWFTKLGKNMAKGLKSAWKGVTKWFSDIGKGIRNAWRGMTSWFTKLGKNMAKGLKSAWKGVTKWFSDIGKGIR
ncbi:phage tail tape measure protein, partial [Lactobacillus acetotolerans]|uniref:phage tail tape measure protein n=1 Tax=Lactobacillus acetotolerans TaxID=1600 RepID=UPI00247FAA9E